MKSLRKISVRLFCVTTIAASVLARGGFGAGFGGGFLGGMTGSMIGSAITAPRQQEVQVREVVVERPVVVQQPTPRYSEPIKSENSDEIMRQRERHKQKLRQKKSQSSENQTLIELTNRVNKAEEESAKARQEAAQCRIELQKIKARALELEADLAEAKGQKTEITKN